MPKVERIFSISNNSKGLWCPFKAVFCQEGYCQNCQVYLDYQGHQITMRKTASQVYRVRQGNRRINEKFIIGTMRASPEYRLSNLFYLVPEAGQDDYR